MRKNHNLTIKKIRVARANMHDFPFDIFYLVPFAHKHILPRLFPWSLCLPPLAPLIDRIAVLRVNSVERLPHKGRATTSYKDENGVMILGCPIDLEQHFITVSILPMTTTEKALKERTKLPGYLVAPRHAYKRKCNAERNSTTCNFEHILTDDTILFTPKGAARPVCKVCPRHLLHMQGKCTLGCKFCFETLVLKKGPRNEQLQNNNPNRNTCS